MRLAILSDIHGNLPALEAVLADARRQGVDGYVSAGDVINGSQPRECVERVRALDAFMIRGNGDGYVLALDRGEAPRAWHESHQWAFVRWAYKHLDRELLDFVASLPEQCVIAPEGTDPIRVVHGSPNSSQEHIVPPDDAVTLALYDQAGIPQLGREPLMADQALALVEEPVLVCGHSHIAWLWERDGRLLLNAGAVGDSNNGDPRARYALLTWREGRWQASLQAVTYDLALVREVFRKTGLLAEGGAFARACLLGAETGLNVPGYFLDHVRRLADEAGWSRRDVVPDEIWDKAVVTFDWEGWGPRSGSVGAAP